MAVQVHAKPDSSPTKRDHGGGGGKEGIPSLAFGVLTNEVDKQDAMRLVADSIAQQRQVASFSVIVHPACFAGLVAGCAAIYRLHARRDFGTALIMMCGLVLAFLAAVRLLTAQYIRLAESFRWTQWIANPEGGDDDYVLAARFGDEIIATLVLRMAAPARSNKKTTTTSSANSGGSGAVIRAWTTRYKYRNKGVGGDMLRLAVLTTRSKCGDEGARLAFDPQHANSARPLPDMFNRPFIKREERALLALEHAIAACDRGESSFQTK
ncbi:hypothetical protein E4U41_003095 [Claviceps citrina]|nr:hypothetical protein E4U41_003095 [Claviceps citrina]